MNGVLSKAMGQNCNCFIVRALLLLISTYTTSYSTSFLRPVVDISLLLSLLAELQLQPRVSNMINMYHERRKSFWLFRVETLGLFKAGASWSS